MDYHPSNGSTKPSYKAKLHKMQRLIRRYVILNAALCDQVSETQEQLVIAKENRRFLLERLQRLSSQQEIAPQVPLTKPIVLNLPPMYPVPSGSTLLSLAAEAEELDFPRKPMTKRTLLPLNSAPKFPLKRRGLTVYHLGKADHYETQLVDGVDLLVPMDYASVRTYGRPSNPELRGDYECVVNSPLTQSRKKCSRFEISCNDLKYPITGQSADECHRKLIAIINNAMGAPVITQLPKGEWFFGYALRSVSQHMETFHTFRQTDSAGNKIDDESDDSLQYEALQRSIAVARFEAQSNVNFVPQILPDADQWEV